MSLPVRNATLTSVAAAGFTEDYDRDPSAAAASKWSGSARVFWSERAAREERGQRSDDVIRRYLVVEATLPVDWAEGDIVTVTYRGAAKTGRVRDIKITTADRVAGVVRLQLEDT